ncbi:MAG: fibronectin type III domain-containing protein [Kineosporiaceae bacterium]
MTGKSSATSTGTNRRAPARRRRRWAAFAVAAATLAGAAAVGGAGSASAAKRPPTDAPNEVTRPSAPLDVTLSDIRDGAVTVSWKPPASDGRRRITYYLVTDPATGNWKRVDGRKTSVRFANLLNLRPVRFQVQAFNVVGASEQSEPSAPATPVPSLRMSVDAPGMLIEGLKPADQVVRVGFAHAAAVPVPIRVRTIAGGSATEGTDYRAGDTTVTVPVGETSVLARIPVVDDRVVEQDETIRLEYSSDLAAKARTASVTMMDDDAEPWVYLDGVAAVDEGDAGVTTMPFGVHLSRPLAEDLTIPVDVSMGTQGQHLTELATLPTSVTIPAGELGAPLPVGVRGDRVEEPDARVSVVLAVPFTAPVRVWVVRRGSFVHDDDEGSAGDDAALTLKGEPNAQDPTAYSYTVTNTSSVAAHGVQLRLEIPGVLDVADRSWPAGCVDGGTVSRRQLTRTFAFRRWSCDLGDLAAGASLRVVIPRVTFDPQGWYGFAWAGVTAADLDDPDHADNRVRYDG